MLVGLVELSSVFVVFLAPTIWLNWGPRPIGERGIYVDGITNGDGWLVGIAAVCSVAIAICFRFSPPLGRLWTPGMVAAGLLIAATGFYDIFKDWSTSPDQSVALPPVTYDADATVWLWLVGILGSLILIASLALLTLAYSPAPVSDVQAEQETEAWA